MCTYSGNTTMQGQGGGGPGSEAVRLVLLSGIGFGPLRSPRHHAPCSLPPCLPPLLRMQAKAHATCPIHTQASKPAIQQEARCSLASPHDVPAPSSAAQLTLNNR